MKRVLALAFALFMLFCACDSSAGNRRGTTYMTMQKPAEPAYPHTITLAVASDAGDAVFNAAQSFCKRINESSKVTFTYDAERHVDPVYALKSGYADVILADGKAAEKLSYLFKTANEDFLFTGYESFSFALNSGEILSRLSRSSGMNVIGCYYAGSGAILSSSPLINILNESEDIQSDIGDNSEDQPTVPILSDVSFYGRADSRIADAFALLGVSAVTFESLNDIEIIERYPSIIEISADEFLSDAPSYIAKINPYKGDPVLTASFHDINMLWLIFEPKIYENLIPTEKAAVDEACAYLFSDLDDAYISKEKATQKVFEENGILVSNNFSPIRTRILNKLGQNDNSSSAYEKWFREQLKSYN